MNRCFSLLAENSIGGMSLKVSKGGEWVYFCQSMLLQSRIYVFCLWLVFYLANRFLTL